MRNTYLIAALAAIMGIGVLSGCTQEAREKYDAAGDTAAQATKETGDAVATDAAKSGEAVKQGAEKAGAAVANTAEAGVQAAKDAAANTAKAVDNGQTTLAVKNALLTSKTIQTKDLNVDTKDNEIILRGSVPTEEQKLAAEKIAEGMATKGMKIVNQLTVSGGK